MEKGQIVQEIQHYFADKPVERAWLFDRLQEVNKWLMAISMFCLSLIF